MGALDVPAEAYYGASTQRAVLNFRVSGWGMPTRFIRALGLIKWGAAVANRDLGLLEARVADAVGRAAIEVADGLHDGEFPVDVFQTGSGTSSHMNANEVIANRAAEILGASKGARGVVHPNDHVNRGQSSNDVVPTAIHLAALLALRDELAPALRALRQQLESRSRETWDVVKTGRTHLQDATPIRMGQVFLGHAGQMEMAERRLAHAREELSWVALGGTAVGTGVNTHPEFARRVCDAVSRRAGVDIRETPNHFQAQATLDAMVEASGSLRSIAVSLLKIANDVRLMASGPRCGIGEISIPEVQPGSSIMPGKVNPVIAESLIQACAQFLAADAAVLQAGQWGFFELNTMMPLAAHNLIRGVEILGAATRNFSERCVAGIAATSRGPEMVEKGLSVVTGLAPLVGYDRAAAIAHEASRTGRTVREVAREQTDLSEEELARALDALRMTEPSP